MARRAIPPPAPVASPFIVVIEDDLPTRRAYRLLLEGYGYRVHDEADGLAGLRAVWRFAPDLVITDVNMPRLSGIDLAITIRSLPETRDVPIIAATGERIPPALQNRGMFDAVLPKPFSPPDLIRVVRGVFAARAKKNRAARRTAQSNVPEVNRRRVS